MENSKTIEDNKLEEVAKALGVSADAIRNFSDETVFNIIGNTYDNASSTFGTMNYSCTFNPLDKLMEAHNKLIESHEEHKKLYERLVQAEKDKVSYL